MKSDFIYRFIHSLDEGETRYCRTALHNNEGPNRPGRVQMFDALAAMASYDADGLRRAVKGSIADSRLAEEKQCLYQLLLQHVTTLQESRRPANDPSKKLQEGKVLLELGLLEEAAEAARRGLRTAVDLEELFLEVSLRELLREVYKGMDCKELADAVTENEYLLETAVSKLAVLIRYTRINDRMFDYIRRYRVTDDGAVKRGIEELIRLPEMQDIKMADSLPSQLRFYFIWNLYHSSAKEHDKALELQKQLVRLWESNRERIGLYPHLYRSAIANLTGKMSITGRMDEAPGYLTKMEQVKTRGRRAGILQFCNVELQYQLYFMNTGKLDEALLREPGIVKGLRRFGSSLPDDSRITFLYNLAVTHLICGHAGSALAYFNRIRELGRLRKRLDLQGAARLLRLLLLCEDGDSGNFSHFLRNSRRFFTANRRLYELEETVCSWLRQHHPLTGGQQRRDSFDRLASELAPHVDERAVGAEEMKLWADAKRQQRPLRTLFDEKLAEQKGKKGL